MAEERAFLEDKLIARLPYAETGSYNVRDEELTGFFLRVGKRTKTFLAEGAYWRDGVREFQARVKLGEFGEITPRAARAKAKTVLGDIAAGERPGEEPKAKAGALTLREAWDRYRVGHLERKGRDEGTIANYRDHVERLMADWLDLPLARLGKTPKLVADRHDLITTENGPYIANGAMRSLRAIYNHAYKTNPDLPPVNPVKAVDWNTEARRDTGMGTGEVGAWLEELFELANELRREFHLFTLLTGSRPTALKRIKLTDINFRERLLHIPRPKGGSKKAFDIPLSPAMTRCILRAIRLSRAVYPAQAATWLFAADSKSGHIEVHKEDRIAPVIVRNGVEITRKGVSLSKFGNDLRQSYRTVAQAAGVAELDAHLLMNHSLPGVNAGYITRDKLARNHLRAQQERISAVVVELAAKTKNAAIVAWLRSGRIQETAPSSSQHLLIAA